MNDFSFLSSNNSNLLFNNLNDDNISITNQNDSNSTLGFSQINTDLTVDLTSSLITNNNNNSYSTTSNANIAELYTTLNSTDNCLNLDDVNQQFSRFETFETQYTIQTDNYQNCADEGCLNLNSVLAASVIPGMFLLF